MKFHFIILWNNFWHLLVTYSNILLNSTLFHRVNKVLGSKGASLYKDVKKGLHKGVKAVAHVALTIADHKNKLESRLIQYGQEQLDQFDTEKVYEYENPEGYQEI